MGYPINSTDDDVFFVTSTDGKRALFPSVEVTKKTSSSVELIGYPIFIGVPQFPVSSNSE